MVSEFMLQQTPVERVREPWRVWVERWPTAGALAAAPVGEAIRAWGRLGYPRRALRLHAAASVITNLHGGEVPADKDQLLSLPGVGVYTAAAISAFAYSRREVVLDTNVRRVLGRISAGRAFPPPTVTAAESAQASAFLPRQGQRAARWAIASMELGALICTARATAVPVMSGKRPLPVATQRLPDLPRRPTPPQPNVRRYRPAVPRGAARRHPRRRRATLPPCAWGVLA